MLLDGSSSSKPESGQTQLRLRRGGFQRHVLANTSHHLHEAFGRHLDFGASTEPAEADAHRACGVRLAQAQRQQNMRGLQDAGATGGVRRQSNVRLQGPDEPIGIASRKCNAEVARKASLPITVHACIRTAG